ncbi:MAG: FAD-dependent oxidoreductase [Eudoraea sp.]|jgi:glycine/D-amino acid oxidase-like deaminating enzyme|uniref:NAD(P)/FAD-dependent oxidoreductase n=1 Tax=Eudoraea sp. TaxID=1979955 RepID=UPI003C721FFD
MNLSYWEYKTWLSNIDFTIVGSGIVGLNCAYYLSKKHPKAKILILEKGTLPQGASTKNAGFACFGSISEIVSDLKIHSQEEVLELVRSRWEGIQLLRATLGDSKMDFQQHGGHELFLKENTKLFNDCSEALSNINKLLKPVYGEDAYFLHRNTFKFNNIVNQYISSQFEAQINTGTMMNSLLSLVRHSGVNILNSIGVTSFDDSHGSVKVYTNQFEFQTKKLIIATNGFANELLDQEVKPARAQVLITKPIKNLEIKGTFHLDEGFYYFRNIENRILLGGGRNLDFKTEETSEFGQTELIQNRLDSMLREIILPDTDFEIERRWSGIMGIGNTKKPIVKQLSDNLICGVRLGGMGIAIGSLVGKNLADLT